MLKFVQKFLKLNTQKANFRGLAAIEYALILSITSVVFVIGFKNLGQAVTTSTEITGQQLNSMEAPKQ